MHILYLHQHFVARSGTSGGRSHEFARILLERGHRITLVTGAFEHSGLPVSKRLFTYTQLDGIDLWMIRVPYRQKLSMIRRSIAFGAFMILATWLALRIRKVDLVFATSTPLTIAVPGITAARWNRCPFVFEVRDLWPQIPIDMGLLRNPILKAAARRLERFAYRNAREIVALSPGAKAGIVSTGIPEERVTVIPNSSDVGLFRVGPEQGAAFRASRPEIGDRPLVVYAGAFGRVNGLSYVLELARQVEHLDSRIAFLLIGKGSEKDQLMQVAKDNGLLGRSVFFQDPMPRHELPKILSAATMLSSFVTPLPILQENSANKFFDAFAAGKPIVINYGGWQAEILNTTGAGLVLDPSPSSETAARLVNAVGDRKWLESAAIAARRLGEERFNRGLLALQLERVFMRAAGAEPATPTSQGPREGTWRASAGRAAS